MADLRDAAEILYGTKPEPEPVQEAPEETLEAAEAVPDTPKADTPQEESEPVQAVAEPQGETQTPSKEATPAAEDKPAETEAEAQEPEEVIEEVPVSSLAELLQAEGYDADWFDSLNVAVKVDGQVSQVPLSELRASFQMQQAAEKRLEDAKAKSAETNQWIADRQKELTSSYAEVAALVAAMERMLEIDQAALKKLRDEEGDEVGYLAAKDRLQERAQAFNLLRQQARESATKALTGQRQEEPLNEEENAKVVAEETQKLREAIPEWRNNPELEKQQAAALTQYLMSEQYGWDWEDLNSTQDHRMFVLARKAMLWDEQQSKTDAVRKRVVKIPKVAPTGSSKTATSEKPRDRAEILYGRR